MKKLDLLKPVARPIFERFLTLLDKEGLRYSVLETLRSQEVQDAYYAQGRKTFNEIIKLRKKAGLYPISLEESGRIITYAKYSIHQAGEAADIVPVLDSGKIPWDYAAYKELWSTFGRLGQDAGLEWGGTWTPLLPCGLGWDPPHYQIKEPR